MLRPRGICYKAIGESAKNSEPENDLRVEKWIVGHVFTFLQDLKYEDIVQLQPEGKHIIQSPGRSP